MGSLLMFNSIFATPARALGTAAVPKGKGSSFGTSHVQFFNRDSSSSRGSNLKVVTRAGASSSSYVFAFVLPLSLLALTVFASLKLDDKLERQYLEELIINEAMKDQEEQQYDEDEDEEEEDDQVLLEEKFLEPALPRTRNRPKREV
ncbi:hypothetical protein CISIN_1g032144mg [Citrus sinensis]|uniref:High chlorophyll fluorescence 153 n=1 Tax=Citrus sinensis TaxID=2711 RepID=A0A067GU65_CITSI|nr:hypothetical protein CISIN_1g032144mg [Citrus sinensis]